MIGVAQFSEFRLELGYAAAQSRYLESQSLFVIVAYVAQQGACHLATLQFTVVPIDARLP